MGDAIRGFFLAVLLGAFGFMLLVRTVSFDIRWYHRQFATLNVYATIEQATALARVENVLQYVSGQGELRKEYYTEVEILHLADIKALVRQWNSFIFWLGIGAVIFLGYTLLFGWRRLLKTLFFTNVFTLGFFLGIGAAAWFSFDYIFLLFHQVAFKNDFWQLDPSVHSLIVLFPPEIFLRLFLETLFIMVLTAAIGVVLLLPAYIFIRINGRK